MRILAILSAIALCCSGKDEANDQEKTHVYLADSESGLRIVDVSDPCNPREVGCYDTPGSAEGVFVLGGPGVCG
ncbi:MAG: hypothetical protein ABIM74_09630 [candidate division WOR-3 bacterium]